jgi:hypothetical protein
MVAVAENTGKGAVAVRGWLSYVAYAADQGSARSALPAVVALPPPVTAPSRPHPTAAIPRNHATGQPVKPPDRV